MAAHGTLVVWVTTARARIPLEGTTVAVTKKRPGGKPTLLFVQTVDENGKTTPFPIPAPAAEKSESPGTVAPFALCDVFCDHPDYELLVVGDVQVFSGVETLQEMALVPLPEHVTPRDATDEVRITPQLL